MDATAFHDHFSKVAAAYRLYRPTYPAELLEYVIGRSPARRLACDIACGSGQVAVALARRFEAVEASDASAEQVAQAQPCARVSYRVAPAEKIAAASGTVDLVTVGQAIHWLDTPSFFAEADRVLVPGGILAVWGYAYIDAAEPELQVLLESLQAKVADDWPPERQILDRGYRDLAFPYPRLETPPLSMTAEWTGERLAGYFGTWSAVRAYRRREGVSPLPPILDALGALGWNRTWSVRWPLVLYVGRKPNP